MNRPHQPPLCPRCGYDLSGLAAAWGDRCPLEGVCSECGLTLPWVDAFRPDQERVRGLYEHARGPRQALWWSIRTLGLVALPWRFWGRVTMAMTPRLGRAFGWSLLATAILWAAGSLASHAGYLMYVAAPPMWAGPAPPLPALLNGWLQPILVVDALEPGLAPLGIHFDRGWPPLWFLPALAVIPAAGAWPLMFLLLGDTRRMAKVRWAHLLRATAYSLAPIPMLASLRLVHVLGWCAAFAPSALSGSRTFGRKGPWSWVPIEGHAGEMAACVILVAWVQLWWLFAIVRGFRLHMGWGVWVLLAIVSVMAVPLTALALGLLIGILQTM